MEVDSLHTQYEQQVLSLQRQLEADQRNNQEKMERRLEKYGQLAQELQTKLNCEQQACFELVLHELTQVHDEELQQLEATHQSDLSLELTALKVSLEQIYKSKCELELEALKQKHKEETTEIAHRKTGVFVDSSLTEQYNQLIQSISHNLERSSRGGHADGFQVPLQEIHSLLLSQQEEINQLRSKLLKEYESLLQSRTQVIHDQSQEVSNLEEQLGQLQSQFGEQLQTVQDKLQARDEGQSWKESHKQQDELKAYYEHKMETMEAEFEEKIKSIREKYEGEIHLICADNNETLVKVSGASEMTSPTPSQQQESSNKTLVLDIERDSFDAERSVESELCELKDSESRLQSGYLDENVIELRQRVEHLKLEAAASLAECDSLQQRLDEKDCVIRRLLMEKGESEKLSRDIMERESCDFRDEMSLCHSLVQDNNTGGSTATSQAADFCDWIEANVNNNCSSQSIEDTLEKLHLKMEKLERQLAEARDIECRLRAQMEDKDHTHKEMLESLRQELDHEKQVEVESLQSEFQVQLEIELKRQAAEMGEREQGKNDQIMPERPDSLLSVTDDSGTLPAASLSQNTSIMLSGLTTQEGSALMSLENSSAVAVIQNMSDDSKASTSAVSSPGPSAPVLHAAHTWPLTDIEKEIEAMRDDYETLLRQLRQELQQREEETSNHQQQLHNVQQQLNEAEERYERLVEGVQNGEYPELKQLMKDKYDEELDLAKALMQKDLDECIQVEKKKCMEKHRKLMEEILGDRGKEEEEMKLKHKAELAELRQSLSQEFEEKLREYEKRLAYELQDGAQEENEEDRTLPGIVEITLSLQEQFGSPDSEVSCETSSVQSPKLCEMAVQCEASEDIEEGTYVPLSLNERQEMELKIQQLMSQVEHLNQQLAEISRSELILAARKTPQHTLDSGDESALIAMLQSDLDRISAERESVQRTNARLLSILSDTVKTYVGVEDTINCRLSQVISEASRSSVAQQADASTGQSSVEAGIRCDSQSHMGSPNAERYEWKVASVDVDNSQDSQTLENASILSSATDEGLDISQKLAEGIFVGPDLDAEGEDILTDARGRLQTAVGQLLELMERSTMQLMEAKATQQALLERLETGAREVERVQSQNCELKNELAAEIEAKEYLGVELHKAEGLLSGYSAEHESLEGQIQALEEQREALIVELDTTRSKLEEFQRLQSELDCMREELSHQQELLQANAGQEMQATEQLSCQPDSGSPALLNEVARLNVEKREETSQLQHQLQQCHKKLAEQEATAEQSERHFEAAIQERNQTIEDLRLQLENVERQLKASKAFVDEQLLEREQEREEHQKDVDRLQQLLEGKSRNANCQHKLETEIADLTEQLHARIASHSAMHQRTLDLQKALQDKELSAHELKAWVAQLETELDERGNMEEQLKQRIARLEKQLTHTSENKDEDTEENKVVSIANRKEDSSPVATIPASQQLSFISIGEEVERCQQLEEELEHENAALKAQVQQQLVQISGLRNQLDQLRHYRGTDMDSDTSTLRLKLQAERDTVEKMEEKLHEAKSKIENLEDNLKSKDEEVEMIKQKVARFLEMAELQEENESLKRQLEEVQSHLSSVSSPVHLPPQLLEEKNAEIQNLRDKFQQLQEELALKVDQEILQQSQLQALQTQVKEKNEEISDLQDNITSLRRGEPCLDLSLPLHEESGSILNISMTGKTSGSTQMVSLTSLQQELQETLAERELELHSVREHLEQAKKDLQELRVRVELLSREKEENQTDQEKIVNSLEETVQEKDQEIYQLTLTLEEMKQQVQDLTEMKTEMENQLELKEEELSEAVEDRDKSQEQLHEKEDRLDQMIPQIDSLQQEISSLTTFQHELQKDFDTVQSMLEEKEKEIESLTKELTDSKLQTETMDTLLQLEKMVASLQKQLVDKQNVVEEKEEELYELHDKLEEMDTVKEELAVSKRQLAEMCEQLEQEERLRSTREDTGIQAKSASLEEELKVQASTSLILTEQVKSLKQQMEALHKMSGEREKDLHLQLEAKEKEVKELSNLKCQLEETEERLRLHQSAVLDAQSEKEQLQSQLQADLQEKEQTIQELESQLRFRQACILDMEAERERLLEEKEDRELELREEILKKEQAIEELQRKCEQFNDEGMQLNICADLKLQDNYETQKLRKRLLEASEEMVALSSQLKETDERLVQTSQQLTEREDQLQTEIHNLPADITPPPLHSDKRTVEREVVQCQLQGQINEPQVQSCNSMVLSVSLPQGGPQPHEWGGMSRWDSEPSGLALGRRDSVYLRFRMSEIEHISRQQQKELADKNQELDRVRQDLEQWLKMGKGQDSQQLLLKEFLYHQEKEMRISLLESEGVKIRKQLEEKEYSILSLREQILNLKTCHQDQLALRDDTISQHEDHIVQLKASLKNITSSDFKAEGPCLSPETKKSISNLRVQLRRAHAALQDMQQGCSDGGDASQPFQVCISHETEEEHQLEETESQQRLEEQQHASISQQKEQLSEMADDGVQELPQRSSLTRENAVPERLQALLQRLKELGEHFVSVSDLHYLQQYLRPFQQRGASAETLTWTDEHRALEDTIEALKALLQQAERIATLHGLDQQRDWRAELLQGLLRLFEKEREVFQAKISIVSSCYPEVNIVTLLEARLHDWKQVHQSGLEEILRADRQSMIDEIESLHHRLLEAGNQLEDARDQLTHTISKLKEAKSSSEWKLQRQIQMLEYKLQQEAVVQDDLKKSLKLERQRVSELVAQSSQDRTHALELQSELSSTQIQLSKVKDALEQEKQRFSSVIDALEEERSKSIRVTNLLDSAKHKLYSLQAEARQGQIAGTDDGYIQEVQEELRRERLRSAQFSEAEEKAKGEVLHLVDETSHLKRQLSALQDDYEAKLEDLHREHMEEEFQRRLEVESQAKLSEVLDTERGVHQAAMEQERSIRQQLKREVDILKSESCQLRHHYETEKSRADHLKLKLDQAKKAEATEQELATIHRTSQKVLQMVDEGKKELKIKVASSMEEEVKVQLNECCSRLEALAMKLHRMSSARETEGETEAKEELDALTAMLRELRHLRSQISEKDKAGQIQKLLEDNQQLAEQVLKLKKERDSLGQSLYTLEARVQPQVKLPQYLSDTASDEDVVYDRTIWASERLTLQMALDSAEHEIQRLRAEIQQFRNLVNSEGHLNQLNVEKSQRLYGKYLRAESFRKALVYQKKYLLLLLGGYRDTEQETLAILASMGGFPSPATNLQSRRIRTQAFTLFRSVGRVMIAVFRMKYLVKKWKRATRVGSPVVTGQINQQHAYIPSLASYPSHQRRQPPQSYPHKSSSTQSTTSIDCIDSLSNGEVSSSYTRATLQPAQSYSCSTPPTKDLAREPKLVVRGNREEVRRQLLQDDEPACLQATARSTSQPTDREDNFLQYLESVQHQLSQRDYESTGSSSSKHGAWR